LDSSAGKDAGDVGAGAIRPGDDVAAVVEVDLASEDFGIRIVTNRHKKPVHLQPGGLLTFDVFQLKAAHTCLATAKHFFDNCSPNEVNLRIPLSLVLNDTQTTA